MYQVMPQLKCSKCGSFDNESYSKSRWPRMITGIRCLACGHEKESKSHFHENSDDVTPRQWVSANDPTVF